MSPIALEDSIAIYVRPTSPFWWALLEGTDDGKGNPVRFSTKILIKGATPAQTKENRSLAYAAYVSQMGDVARDRFDLPSARGMITFAVHADWYETHHTAKHKGVVQERRKLARLRAHFGRYALDQITPNRWQEYATARTEEGVAPNTIGRELAIMKTLLNTAVGEHIDYNPLATVKRKTAKLTAKRTMTQKDEARLLNEFSDRVAKAQQRARRDRTVEQARREDAARREMRDLYLVGVGTLLRQANLIELRRRDHRGDRLVVDTKTGPHQVSLTGPSPLQRRAAATLKRRLPKTEDGVFFPIWQGRFSRDRNGANAKFLQGFRRACTRAGIPWGLTQGGVVWHTATRASGATRLLREHGIDVRTVQLLGGWRSLDQMADYLGIDLDLRGSRATA